MGIVQLVQPFHALGCECAEQLGQGVPHAFSMKYVICLYCIAKLHQESCEYVSDIDQDSLLPTWSSAIKKNSLKGQAYDHRAAWRLRNSPRRGCSPHSASLEPY